MPDETCVPEMRQELKRQVTATCASYLCQVTFENARVHLLINRPQPKTHIIHLVIHSEKPAAENNRLNVNTLVSFVKKLGPSNLIHAFADATQFVIT